MSTDNGIVWMNSSILIDGVKFMFNGIFTGLVIVSVVVHTMAGCQFCGESESCHSLAVTGGRDGCWQRMRTGSEVEPGAGIVQGNGSEHRPSPAQDEDGPRCSFVSRLPKSDVVFTFTGTNGTTCIAHCLAGDELLLNLSSFPASFASCWQRTSHPMRAVTQVWRL